jgi:hypothetical protein
MKYRAPVSHTVARWSPTNQTRPHGGREVQNSRPIRRAMATVVGRPSSLATAAARYVGCRTPLNL